MRSEPNTPAYEFGLQEEDTGRYGLTLAHPLLLKRQIFRIVST
jgi:hypothetical protein